MWLKEIWRISNKLEIPGHQQLLWRLWNNSWQIQSSTRQECISHILLENSYRQRLRIDYLWSWTVDMQTIFHNIQISLEESWYYLNLCMEWLTMESYFLISWQSGWLKQASFNLNVKCLYVISMHQMIFLFYLMLMTVSIGIILKLLEIGFWILCEIYSMWTSWDMPIGSCQ